MKKEAIITKTNPTRAFVLHVAVKGEQGLRGMEEQLQEAIGLAEAIFVDVVAAESVTLSSVKPNTYIGGGKVEELAERVKAESLELVIINANIGPKQQHNLERAMGCKVIDRTALIIEIFGERAATKEGRLQVELAALEYQKSRLVRSWTHLERQRGGAGFMGGPGERQIESDRRMINDQIIRLKQQLEKVQKTRSLHRKEREKRPYPIVALVGYTNAGKSTLFNRLTGAEVLSKDMLFATLDPTMRQVVLPSGLACILSDTVGFIADLPTQLIAAFRATLEEVVEADVILHVRDIASDASEAEKEDVLEVMDDLGVGEGALDIPVIEVWNKVDLLQQREGLPENDRVASVSALDGQGCGALLQAIDAVLLEEYAHVELVIPHAQGKVLSFLHEHGRALESEHVDEGMRVKAMLSAKHKAQLERLLTEK